MKIKNLIKKLQKFDENSEVIIRGEDDIITTLDDDIFQCKYIIKNGFVYSGFPKITQKMREDYGFNKKDDYMADGKSGVMLFCKYYGCSKEEE